MAILDRIFIAREIAAIGLADKWEKLIYKAHDTKNSMIISEALLEIHSAVTASALKIIE